AHRRCRDPYRWQSPGPLQPIQSFCIQLVALIDAAHHEFGQPRVNQLRLPTSALDLIDYPVPVADRLYPHGRSSSPSMDELSDPPVSMGHATFTDSFSFRVLYSCPSVFLVNVQCDVFHNGCPPRSLILITAVTLLIAFIVISMTSTRIATQSLRGRGHKK